MGKLRRPLVMAVFTLGTGLASTQADAEPPEGTRRKREKEQCQRGCPWHEGGKTVTEHNGDG